MSIRLNFNYKKATQALNFFACEQGGRINKLKALKLVYFADRYHLRKYGRPITNDDYWAMKYGPVPSGTRDVSALNREYLDDREIAYASSFIRSSGHGLVSLKPVDDAFLSESDTEALGFAWAAFGAMKEFDLAQITHAYPEWRKHEEALEIDSRIHMHLEDFLEDPEGGVEKCYELSSDTRQQRLEQLRESAEIACLWS